LAANRLIEGGEMRTTRSAASAGDQANLLSFKLTLVVQGAAAAFFGLAPILVTAPYAQALGFAGTDVLIYRLGGAATTGYLVAPMLALLWGSGWQTLRIPAIATLTFTIGAFAASAIELIGGARQPVVPFVAGAALVFTAIAAWWFRRDEGAPIDPGPALTQPGRVIIGLATLSAATFGVLPLVAPGPFASLFGLSGNDPWVYRIAGAACLGYATAGIASLRAPGYGLIRYQSLAAITFNALGAVSAWIALAGGNGGLLAPVVAAAATFFAIALIWLDRQLARS
jgi:hypothetical protein